MNFLKKNVIWLVPVAIGVLIVLCILALKLRPEPVLEVKPPKLANVEVMTLVPRQFQETLELPARIIADKAVILSAESAGRLDEWRVAEGAAVEKGQVLAVINDDELRARLEQTEASVTAGESQLRANEVALTQSRTQVKTAESALVAADSDYDFQTQEYKRIKTLRDQNVVSTARLQGALNTLNQSLSRRDQAREAVKTSKQGVVSAEAAVAVAKSQLVQARKQVELLSVQLEKTRIKAPFAGRVDKRLVDAGGLVAVSTPVIGLYDLSHVRAVMNVGDRYVPFLDQGNSAVSQYMDVTLPGAKQKITSSIILPGMPKLTGGTYANMELPAEIARVAQASDPLSNTFEVELRMANPGEALKQGIIVKGKLGFLAYDDALIVPLQSLVVTDSGIRVMAVEKIRVKNTVAKKPEGKQKEKAEKRDEAPAMTTAYTVRARTVIPVSIQKDNVLIRGDLKRGDQIIMAGGKGVVDGERVKVLVEDGRLVKPVTDQSEEE